MAVFFQFGIHFTSYAKPKSYIILNLDCSICYTLPFLYPFLSSIIFMHALELFYDEEKKQV